MSEIIGAERDALLLRILKNIAEAKPHADAEAWERGWTQALENFRDLPLVSSLLPAFIKDYEPTRHRGGFHRGVSEMVYVCSIHDWLAEQILDCDNVYEFGCGTGFNLVALAKRAPEKCYVGLDRSYASAQLVLEAAEALELPILSGQFDMLEPRADMPHNVGAFTFGSMEQLGDFKPFIEWLLKQKPRIVVHIEPIPELLDPDNLVDWLSLEFHRKRGYTVGLLPYLQAHPQIEVMHVERSHFGSLFLESYARIVWRPRG